jgi:hypothetical protein
MGVNIAIQNRSRRCLLGVADTAFRPDNLNTELNL